MTLRIEGPQTSGLRFILRARRLLRARRAAVCARPDPEPAAEAA